MSDRRTPSRFLIASAGVASLAAVLVALSSSSEAIERRGLVRAPQVAPAAALEAPESVSGPVTSQHLLVERLAILGASPRAASDVGQRLADDMRLGESPDIQALVEALELPANESEKAGHLMIAFLAGEPLQLLGLPDESGLRTRALEMSAAGIDPDLAVSLLREQATSLDHRTMSAGAPGIDGTQAVGLPPGTTLGRNPVVNAFCKTCPQFDFGAITPTPTYQTHSSTLTEGDCKMYKFTLLANRSYRFTFCEGGGTAAFDTVLTAWNSTCNLIGSVDDSCGVLSQFDVTAGPTTGYMFLRVASANGTGAYTLAYRETGAPTTPGTGPCKRCPQFDVSVPPPTLSNQTVSGSIAPGGCFVIRVPVQLNRNYRFTFCGPDGDADFDTVLTSTRGNCSPGPSNDDTCGLLSRIDMFANASQYFYITVRGFDQDEFGSFTLAYREQPTTCLSCPNANFGPFSPGVNPATHSSSVSSTSTCKLYAFNLVVGRTYRFTTCESGGTPAFNTRLTLFDNGCNSVASNDDAAGCGNLSRLSHQATYTGLHYLEVASADGSLGTYTLAYMEVCRTCPDAEASLGTPPSGGPFAFTSGSLVRGGCRIFAVNLVSGGTYRFSLCPVDGGSAAFDSVLRLFDPSCTAVANNNDACGTASRIGNYAATTTGTHYIRITGNSALDGGAYTLAYRRTN